MLQSWLPNNAFGPHLISAPVPLFTTPVDTLQPRSVEKMEPTGSNRGWYPVRRGYTTPYKFLSERKQHTILVAAGVEERVIYGRNDWESFVRSLREGDEAVVAELQVFGSRKALGQASAQVAARGAVLLAAVTETRIDPPTLSEAHRTETQWAKQRSFGTRKRAKELSDRGVKAAKEAYAAVRMDRAAAKAIWLDAKRYRSVEEALEHMPGWTRTTAWRHFRKRPEPPQPKRKN